MEGLLGLLVISWIFSFLSKKGKQKSNRRAVGAKKEYAARHKAQNAEKRYPEPEKRALLPEKENDIDNLTEMHEGESSVLYERMEEAFRGSMQDESTEGECSCAPELDHARTQLPETESVYSNEIGKKEIADLSPRGLVQGFVMSEILNRPGRHVRQR